METCCGNRRGKSFEGSAPLGMSSCFRTGILKRGEPHGRLQGAIDLQSSERSKPSESGGTARTERAEGVATLCRGTGFGLSWSGRLVFVSTEGRSLNEPHERCLRCAFVSAFVRCELGL